MIDCRGDRGGSRRHPLPMIIVALVAFVLLGGLVGLMFDVRRWKRERQEEDDEY